MHREKTVLPSEITDNIIDFFHQNKPRLLVCSLVCKAWLPSCRHHLFSTVSLFGQKSFRQFILLAGNTMLGPMSLDNFVKHLHLTNLSSKANLNFATKFRALTGLHALRSIYLNGFFVMSGAALIEFLASFPLLDEFHLCPIDSLPDKSKLSYLKNYHVPPQLRVIDIWSYDIPLFSTWICSQEDYVPRVQFLTLRAITSSELQATCELLHVLGTSLIDLTIDFDTNEECPTAAAWTKYLDLSYNTEIRTISFFNMGDVQEDNHKTAEAVPAILSCIFSHHIETINLVLCDTVPEAFEILDCALLESILKRPQFRTLRTIRFELLGCETAVDEQRIRDSLPFCASWDILVIGRFNIQTADSGRYTLL